VEVLLRRSCHPYPSQVQAFLPQQGRTAEADGRVGCLVVEEEGREGSRLAVVLGEGNWAEEAAGRTCRHERGEGSSYREEDLDRRVMEHPQDGSRLVEEEKERIGEERRTSLEGGRSDRVKGWRKGS
jgi:hypothetical protein